MFYYFVIASSKGWHSLKLGINDIETNIFFHISQNCLICKEIRVPCVVLGQTVSQTRRPKFALNYLNLFYLSTNQGGVWDLQRGWRQWETRTEPQWYLRFSWLRPCGLQLFTWKSTRRYMCSARMSHSKRSTGWYTSHFVTYSRRGVSGFWQTSERTISSMIVAADDNNKQIYWCWILYLLMWGT